MDNIEKWANGWAKEEFDAFDVVMGDPTMPDYKDPNYDEWLFHKAWQAALDAAPTPPAQEGYEYRDRWGANMLSPGPWLPCSKTSFETMQLPGSGFETRVVQTKAVTPPAQEDEPVAWMHDQDGRVECIHDSVKQLWIKVGQVDNGVRFYREMHRCKVEHYTIPLYPRPQSDELRKAAEELLRILDQTYVGCSAKDSMESLRAALEEK